MNLYFFERTINIKIELKFSEKEFHATASICVAESNTENVEFLLNNSLNIEEITCVINKIEKKANWKMDGVSKLEFRSLSNKIVVLCEENTNKIIVKYSGSVDAWYNVITDEIKALSWYSVWFPQEISVYQEHDEVDIIEASNYFIVKGIYVEEKGIWEYGGHGYDSYNIVAYKKDALKVASNEYLNIYYVDDNIWKSVEETRTTYHKVLNYYNGSLFRHKQIAKLDIVCLSPAIQSGGGYKRKDLIFTTSLDNSLDSQWLIAHELAHEWCIGASSGSWEDWLNETTAEWSALLYALKHEDTNLFDVILKNSLDVYNTLPPIKTIDGNRPNGVHNKGTVLFYHIYQKYGVDVVCKLVQIFAALDEKCTDKFIYAVEQEISPEVAVFIKEGLLL